MRTMDALLDVEFPVLLRFGSVRLPFHHVMEFGLGSLITFEDRADDPVELLVHDRVVARGEVVMVRGSYAIRITEVSSETGNGVGSQLEGSVG